MESCVHNWEFVSQRFGEGCVIDLVICSKCGQTKNVVRENQ